MNFRCKTLVLVLTLMGTMGVPAQTPAPAMSMQEAAAKLGYVPRQGTFFEVHRVVPKELADMTSPSIQELGDVYHRIVDTVCATNAEGRMDNWYGLVHDVTQTEQGLLVEIRVAQGASVIAAVAAGTDMASLLASNGAGSWIRFSGQLLPDGERCLRMAPPLSVERLSEAVYAAKLESANPIVDSATVDLLDAVVPAASPWRTSK